MMTEKAAADFMDAVVDRLAERLLPVVIEHVTAQMPKDQDRVFTVDEAAEYSGISNKLLYLLLQQKQIPHIKAGVLGSRKPKILIKKSRIDAWIADQERASVQKEAAGK